MHRRTLVVGLIGLLVLAVVAVGLSVWFVSRREAVDSTVETFRSEEVFPPGAAWRFLATTSTPRADWTSPGFDDSAWSDGLPAAPTGRSGQPPETVYLRKTVTLTDATAITGASMQVRTGAALVVFLNGAQATTLGAPASGAVDTWRSVKLPTSLLRDGKNQVAVEVRPPDKATGIGSFDADMQVVRSSQTPPSGSPWTMVTTKHPFTQTSGVAVAGSDVSLWFFEDYRAATPGTVYLMQPDGTVRQWLRFSGAATQLERPVGAVDPEAMAIANGYMYIADTGNAAAAGAAKRPFYTITRFPVPDLATLQPGENVIPTGDVEQVRFTYGSKTWIYRDGEALLVDPTNGQMLVVEKRADAKAAPRVYEVPAEWGNQQPVVAPEVATVEPTIVGISDAAVSPDGRSVWLRDAKTAYEYVVPQGGSLAAAFDNPPARTIALPSQQQGEGLAVDPSNQFLIVTSEGLNQPVYGVPLS